MKSIIRRIMGSVYGRLRQAYYEHRYHSYRKIYGIPSDFGFNGTDIRIYGNGKIEIGKSSYMGTNSTIQLFEGHKVVIGSFCQISHNVRMYTGTDYPDQDFTTGQRSMPTRSGDIVIGDGVWIGANVYINPGVTIGNNSVIGANSVLTKSVPPNAIFGGVPAKLIRMKKGSEIQAD